MFLLGLYIQYSSNFVDIYINVLTETFMKVHSLTQIL